MRYQIHVQRRVPEEPLPQDTGWRTGAELPLCGLQALLHPLSAVRLGGGRPVEAAEP